MPFFQFRDRKLHYVDLDQREHRDGGLAVVFVHGAGSSHLIWTLQLLDFRNESRVIALDLSGHGKSEESKYEADIERGYTMELAALIEHLDLDDFVLVGHSMGGGIVMSYMLNDKFRKPQGAVLVGTSPDLDLTKVTMGLVIEAFEEHEMPYDISALDDDLKTFSVTKLKNIQKHITRLHTRTILKDLTACDEFDITNRVREISVPTFVLVGQDDDIIPPHIAKKLEKLLPRADIAVVKDSDHTPMVEQPAIFNNLLRKFLVWVSENTIGSKPESS
jgi:pimeloyl-ACP methyl ester carboxylesterase